MTHRPDPHALARQARLVAVVIAATMLLWMGAQFVGGRLGLATRWVFLFDLVALAAFFWALAATYNIWRRKRRDGS
ncbi:hypothetical protein DXV76_09570 [Rhodobacteraceae bacterium CCMM004]|nr:hypothetical protein DXV76_09570 [Rhodobacteraceae bacterium CCMM004]